LTRYWGEKATTYFKCRKICKFGFFYDKLCKLLKFAKLIEYSAGQSRTLYSLRHTLCNQPLLLGTDIHILAKQMGISVRILELQYSKLTATMAAEQLA
jgi:hypothetical protein